MSDSPPDQSGGRPARPALPPFRGPAAGASRPAPAARSPLTPRAGTAVPAGTAPRPAVSPIVPRGGVGRPTPARPVVSPRVPTPAALPTPAIRPTPIAAAAPVATPSRDAEVTPVVAQPAVVADPTPEVVASSPDVIAATSGLPLLEVTPAHGEAAQLPEATIASTAPAGASPAGDDWLSAEGALRGEFGELVEDVPNGRAAKAPVLPTPPAPWPSVASPAAETQPTTDGLEELDSSWLIGGDTAASTTEPEADAPTLAEQPAADGTDVGFGAWTPESSQATIPVEAFATPGILDESITEAETWADAYHTEVDAIHGDTALEPAAASGDTMEIGDVAVEELAAAPAAPDLALTEFTIAEGAGDAGRGSDWFAAETADAEVGDEPPPAEPETYLAAEWPDPAEADPSTLVTPVVAVPAVESAWGVTEAAAETESLGSAVDAGADAFDWPADDADTAETAGGAGGASAWGFAAASETAVTSGHNMPTASSLAAAEALERVAAQLRQGTLRADGFSPALGEAAALSAALAALLGVDARWDVQR